MSDTNLTIGGYQFDNHPEEWSKTLSVPVQADTQFNRETPTAFAQEGTDITVQFTGQLSTLSSSDLAELQRLQELQTGGGEVAFSFDPFLSGEGVITGDPFGEGKTRATYAITLSVNSEDTDTTSYGTHQTPSAASTFRYGDYEFGFDPESINNSFNRQTPSVAPVDGPTQTVDNKGLVYTLTVSGYTDGKGERLLWDRAKKQEITKLQAPFAEGWALLSSVSISHEPATPDPISGLYSYQVDFLVLREPSKGVTQPRKSIDNEHRRAGTYVSDPTVATERETGSLQVAIDEGTGAINGEFITFPESSVSLTDNETNYIFAEDPDGDEFGSVSVGTSGFPAGTLPLYEVTTSGGEITNVSDERTILIESSGAGGADFQFEDTLNLTGSADFVRSPSFADTLALIGSREFTGVFDPSDVLSLTDPGFDTSGFVSRSDVLTLFDGGSPSGSQTDTLEWATATDWNNATFRRVVVNDSFGALPGADTLQYSYLKLDHAGGTIRGHYHFDESSPPFTDVSGDNPDATVEYGDPVGTTNGVLGGTDGGVFFDGNDGLAVDNANDPIVPETVDFTLLLAVRPEGQEYIFDQYLQLSGNGRLIGSYDSSNVDIQFFLGNDDSESSKSLNSNSFTAGTDQIIVLRRTGKTFELFRNGTLEDSFTDSGTRNILQTSNNFGMRSNDESNNDIQGYFKGTISVCKCWERSLSDAEVEYIGLNRPGTLTTGFKTFSNVIAPDKLELQNVSATLDNQTIRIIVESDPDGDGTVEETADPIQLDGSGGPYQVTGLSSDTQDVKATIEFETTNKQADMELSQFKIEGTFGTAEDQNPATFWEIDPGLYDTNGVEYEGGGIGVKHG